MITMTALLGLWFNLGIGLEPAPTTHTPSANVYVTPASYKPLHSMSSRDLLEQMKGSGNH